jgi:predicted CoA-binding protein
MNPAEHHVVVLGASPKPDRHSNRAVRLLLRLGYRVTPVHPVFPVIEGLDVAKSLDEVARPVHTMTLYVGPARAAGAIPAILRLAPARVVFNAGSESPELERALDAAGIPWRRDCTLVMLGGGTF